MNEDIETVEPQGIVAVAGGDRSGATSDHHLAELWLSRKRSPHTRRAYAADVGAFLASVGRALRGLTVDDMQRWIAGLSGKPATVARRVAAVRSLLAFGFRTGYLAFDVGRAVEAPSAQDARAERILTEGEVSRILAALHGRDALMARVLYASGARVSEIVGLQWQHVHPRGEGEGAVLTIHGKGAKTRHVLLPARVAADLMAFRGAAPDDAYVFATSTGKPVHPTAVRTTVRAAALKVGISRPVSPHWFRHAHASHALDRGAPIHLVQSTLGHASVATTSRYLHARPDASSGQYLREGM